MGMFRSRSLLATDNLALLLLFTQLIHPCHSNNSCVPVCLLLVMLTPEILIGSDILTTKDIQAYIGYLATISIIAA